MGYSSFFLTDPLLPDDRYATWHIFLIWESISETVLWKILEDPRISSINSCLLNLDFFESKSFCFSSQFWCIHVLHFVNKIFNHLSPLYSTSSTVISPFLRQVYSHWLWGNKKLFLQVLNPPLAKVYHVVLTSVSHPWSQNRMLFWTRI